MERTLATCLAHFTTIESEAAEEISPKFYKINNAKVGLMALFLFFHEEALREYSLSIIRQIA
jgi:hypothetical protein